MEHLKEQLNAYYGKTEPREAFLQTLLTMEAPQAPIPVPTHRKKKLLFPIAAMLIAAIAVLGGGHYLMDALPQNAPPPESAPTSAADFEDLTDFSDFVPVESAAESTPVPNSNPSVPIQPQIDPESAATEVPDTKEITPDQSSPSVSAPQPPPPSNAAPEPDPKPEPPAEEFPSVDAPAEDDPPTEPPVENDPEDPPNTDVAPDPDPPSDDPPLPPHPDDPPDEGPYDPTDPSDDPEVDFPPIGSVTPEISAYYVNESGQHMVYLTNCDTGESSPVNLTPWVTENGYSGTHNLFGYLIEIQLIPFSDGLKPSSGGSFYVSANVIF